MEPKTQLKFMYLFERIGEPLYFGPRGADNIFYMVPMNPIITGLKTVIGAVAFRKNGPVMKNTVVIKSPDEMPDLSMVGKLCPKNHLFSYFSDNHLKAAMRVKEILMKQQSSDDFLCMTTLCRDHPMVNSQLWLFAFASSALERDDMRGFKIPSFVEICPDLFISPTISRLAQEQAMMPAANRKKIPVSLPPMNPLNPESALAYFREDIGLNSHHYHWHLVYTRDSPKGKRDRKGELFYYMHSQMLRRYNVERLGNDLSLTQPISLDDENIVEGYFPKLYSTNAGRVWGTRQTNSVLQNIDRSDEKVLIQDLRTWRDRILEAIDLKYILGPNREMLPLTIDLLGDVIESSTLAPNEKFYGSLHNLGHVLLAFIHDPLELHREEMGVMGDTPTAMRDPVFYRWHTFIDDIFDKFKVSLGPYKWEELIWKGIQVSSISVKSSLPDSQPNTLHTNWMESDIDLGRGLDIRRGPDNGGPVWASFVNLNHVSFIYNISITNSGQIPFPATIRIFMAPRHSERNRRLNLSNQRKLFFELDKFPHTLKPGKNEITRQSKDSSVTIPFEQSFQQLEKIVKFTDDNIPLAEAVCSCGWPSHLLLPRAKPEGVAYDIYVIVSNGAEDQIKRKGKTELPGQNCKESLSFCGILDDLYPDKRAMGYPWDRILPDGNGNEPLSLSEFVKQIPNSNVVEVKIIHRNETLHRDGGAPVGMELVPDPEKSRPSSPIPSRSRDGTPPRQPVYPPVPNWGSRPTSPEKPDFGSYREDGVNTGGRYRFNFPGRWRLGREVSPDDKDDEGWTHVE